MITYAFESILEDKLGVPPTVSEHEQLVEIHHYEKSIGHQRFYLNGSIQLQLDRWRGRSLKLRDYHRWEIGQPDGYHIVCSPAFRRLLETLRLPEHRFYNAEIDVKGKKHPYFVLHFRHEWAQEIDYTQSQFKVVDMLNNNTLVKTLAVGEITNLQHYNQVTQLMGEAANDTSIHYLYPKKLHFLPTIHYDVWGLHGQIVLSPHAKNAIEKAGITGVDMPPLSNNSLFQDLEVVMHL